MGRWVQARLFKASVTCARKFRFHYVSGEASGEFIQGSEMNFYILRKIVPTAFEEWMVEEQKWKQSDQLRRSF